jgi:hypothetical protein
MLTELQDHRELSGLRPKSVAVRAIRDHFTFDPEPVDRSELLATVSRRTGLAGPVATRALTYLMLAHEIGCEWDSPRIGPIGSLDAPRFMSPSPA